MMHTSTIIMSIDQLKLGVLSSIDSWQVQTYPLYFFLQHCNLIFYYTIYSIVERSFGTVSSYMCRGLFLIELVAVQ